MLSLFCGASKSRRKKKNSFSQYSTGSNSSSCYHSALDSYGQSTRSKSVFSNQSSMLDLSERSRAESHLSGVHSEYSSSTNLSVIGRINDLTKNERPKSMFSSTKTLNVEDENNKSPLKRAHSVRFKIDHRQSVYENESTDNIFEKLLVDTETKCKLRRTRSGVSNRSTRRNFGSTTNLSAVEKLSVSSV